MINDLKYTTLFSFLGHREFSVDARWLIVLEESE